MPAWIIGDLHVGDMFCVSLNGRDNVAFHDVGVVDVELETQIVGADLLDDVNGLLRGLQKEPGVSRVLSGSISSVMPRLFNSRAAKRRFSTNVS